MKAFCGDEESEGFVVQVKKTISHHHMPVVKNVTTLLGGHGGTIIEDYLINVQGTPTPWQLTISAASWTLCLAHTATLVSKTKLFLVR